MFGSATTRQLREGFRPGEIGDIEFFLPQGKAGGLEALERVIARQDEFGQKFFLKPEKEGVLFGRSKSGEEFKAIELKAPDLDDGSGVVSGIGVFGFPFSNLQAGGLVDDLVPFGPLRAERAGVQLARKASGSSFVVGDVFFGTSRGQTIPSEFQVAGLGAKRFKDIPDFIIQSSGVQDVQRLKGLFGRAARGERALVSFVESFSPSQRRVLQEAISERVGEANKVFLGELVESPSISSRVSSGGIVGFVASPVSALSPSVSPSPILSPSPRFSLSPRVSPSPLLSVSPSVSPSPSLSPSVSVSPSLSVSPSVSPSPSVSVSPSVSPSPSLSPSLSVSPSPSPSVSPSPVFSPSPSPPISPFFPPSVPPSVPPRKSPSPRVTGKKELFPFEEEFLVFLKEKGVFREVGRGSRSEALKLGSEKALASLAATFKIKKTGGRVRSSGVSRAPPRLTEFFREFKIRGGERIKTPDTFIQRRGKRLSTRKERVAIQRARKDKSVSNGFFGRVKGGFL